MARGMAAPLSVTERPFGEFLTRSGRSRVCLDMQATAQKFTVRVSAKTYDRALSREKLAFRLAGCVQCGSTESVIHNSNGYCEVCVKAANGEF